MAKCAYPECGKIVNIHGCRGVVKVEPWCDSPAVFAALPRVFLQKDGEYRPYRVRKTAVQKGFVLTTLEGVDDRDKAEVLRGQVLYAARGDLPIDAGTLLVAELIGLPVFDTAGARLGTLKDVIRPANTDIYVIETPRGEAMVPAVAEFVRNVGEGGVVLSPIEGMFP